MSINPCRSTASSKKRSSNKSHEELDELPITKKSHTSSSSSSSNCAATTITDTTRTSPPIHISTYIGKKETVHTLDPNQPVLQLTIPSHDNPPTLMLYPSQDHDTATNNNNNNNNTNRNADFLSHLLYPLPLNVFFDSCFRKHAVHIQSNNHITENSRTHHRMQDIIDTFQLLDVPQILQNSSSENIFLWLRSPPSTTTTTSTMSSSSHSPLQSVEISDPHTAYLLHQAGGLAIYCRGSPILENTLVPCLLQGTGLGCGQYDFTGGEKTNCLGRGEVEIFIGTKGHVTGWHTDFQENFTIQLSGKKRWTLKQGTVQYPLRGITPHYHSPDTVESQIKSAKLSNVDFTFGLPIIQKQEDEQKEEEETQSSSSSSRAYGMEMQLDMNPGDILYFPAGMWHTVETLEPGISMNVSLMAMSYASLICKSLEHVLLRKNEWRETVWNCPVSINHDDSKNMNHKKKEVSSTTESSSILTKVDDLLEDLSDVLEQFKRYGGGSASIIPPSLRYPTIISADDHMTKPSEDDNTFNSHNDNEEEEEEEDQHSNKAKEEIIISVSNFSGPSNWSSKAPSSNHILVRNPLASLISLKDIQSFYSTSVADDDDSHNQEGPMYVLNVNFAGNDSHESLIRVVLKDDTIDQRLSMCYDWESKNLPIESSFAPPACLIYYGYLIWIQFPNCIGERKP